MTDRTQDPARILVTGRPVGPALQLFAQGRALSPTVSKAFQRLADAFVGSPAGLSARAIILDPEITTGSPFRE